MNIINISPTLTLYTRKISVITGKSPREAEKHAVLEIIHNVFGSESTLYHDIQGAPFIEHSNVQISVSHCHGLAGVLVEHTGRKIGLDLETTDRSSQLKRIAPRFLAPDELDYWSQNPERLLQAWTIKEAAFKASGLPIADLREIKLSPASPTIIVRQLTLTVIKTFTLNPNIQAAIVGQ